MYSPLNYSQINLVEGTYTPSTNKNFNNKVFDFWCRALFQRAVSTLIIELPNEWKKAGRKDFFDWVLFRNGFMTVTDKLEKYGTIFQPCTLYGHDLYYQYTNCIITNPAINESLDLKIGTDCEIIKLCPDYMGIWDTVVYFAEKLALLDGAENMAFINSKLAYIFGAKNKTAGEALKKLMDKINKGEPTVVADMKILGGDSGSEEMPWYDYTRNVKDSYITSDLLQDMQTILNSFDNEIGIPTVPYQKKERMVTSEAESKEIDATSRATVWLETLRDSFTEVNNRYGLNLSVRLRYNPSESEVDENVTSDNDNVGDS